MRIWFIFLLGLCSASALGQVKYKDLAEEFPTMTRDELKNELKEFILQDLDHPNANFRLALLYAANYRAGDVLTHYEYAMANAEQARLRFTKARQLCDQREVERNNEFYAPLFGTRGDRRRAAHPRRRHRPRRPRPLPPPLVTSLLAGRGSTTIES